MMSKYEAIVKELAGEKPLFPIDVRTGASKEQVAELEAALDLILPDDYRDFFLHFGGLQLYCTVCPLEQHSFWSEIPVSVFYGVDEPFSLLETYNLHHEDNPAVAPWFLAFAEVDGGPQFYMSLGEDYGKIYLWDKMEDSWPASANFFPISKSFDEFIRSLYREPEAAI